MRGGRAGETETEQREGVTASRTTIFTCRKGQKNLQRGLKQLGLPIVRYSAVQYDNRKAGILCARAHAHAHAHVQGLSIKGSLPL